MRIAYFLALGLVLYTYAGYPLMIALLARLKPKPWLRADEPRSASVILPVHNGLAMLRRKLDALLAMDDALIAEVIVVLDGCTDGSAKWLAGAVNPRLKRVVLQEQVGKAAALSHGMAYASAELLLFVDVRPEVTEHAVRQLFCNFADPAIGCVAGELQVAVDGQHDGGSSAVGGLYWRYEQAIRNCEAAYDSPVGVYGGFYAMRRSLACPPPDGLILDDMHQPLHVIRQGFRSVVDGQAIVRDRWPATSKGEFTRKVRTLAGNFQLLAMEPWLLTPKNRVLLQTVSHKVLRLIVPYCLVILFVSAWLLAAENAAWILVAGAQTALLCLGLLGLCVRVPVLGKIASPLGALLLLNAAAVAGLWTYMFTDGPLWKIWKPSADQSAPLQQS